jgi:transposase InsO family protein
MRRKSSVDHPALLRKRGILIPMSGRGNCHDNSMVLRRETVHWTVF